MIDLGSLPILDVVVGLAFMYFVLSIVCSSVQEVIASVFKLRAQTLETGVRALLGSKDAADKFFADWRIKSLGTPKWRDEHKIENKQKPSYIAPGTAALVILDTVAPPAARAAAKPGKQPPSKDLIAEIAGKLDHVHDPDAKAWLASILVAARGDVDAARTKVEEGFNDVMGRAAGWYKRKVQIILFVVALAVAVTLNADTIHVADRLARDEAVRAKVLAQAAQAGATTTNEAPTAADVEKAIESARATALPLGWSGENDADASITGVLQKGAGLMLTAFALMLGAPFWFDLLGKFARLRSSGNRIGTPKDDALAASDRDDRLRSTPPRL